MKTYLDESGDLGWIFDKPFANGGSSRFLTISYLIIPDEKYKLTSRLVKNTYVKFKLNTKKEIKGCNLRDDVRNYFLGLVLKLLEQNEDITIGCITVRKNRVFEHIRKDSNKLYNYMIKEALLDKIKMCSDVKLIRDERSVKVASGNSLIEYLQTVLWFDKNSKTVLIDIPNDSSKNKNLLFIDWVCNSIYRFYEFNQNDSFDLIKNKIKIDTFLF